MMISRAAAVRWPGHHRRPAPTPPPTGSAPSSPPGTGAAGSPPADSGSAGPTWTTSSPAGPRAGSRRELASGGGHGGPSTSPPAGDSGWIPTAPCTSPPRPGSPAPPDHRACGPDHPRHRPEPTHHPPTTHRRSDPGGATPPPRAPRGAPPPPPPGPPPVQPGGGPPRPRGGPRRERASGGGHGGPFSDLQPAHPGRRVPLPGRDADRCDLLDRGQVGGRQLDVQRGDVLLQVGDPPGARDGDHVGALGEHPGQRQLGRRHALGLGDRDHPVQHLEVLLEVLALEPRGGAPEVVRGEVVDAADLPGEE